MQQFLRCYLELLKSDDGNILCDTIGKIFEENLCSIVKRRINSENLYEE
jgi:hypothetical protein